MKHFFFINPAAGLGKMTDPLAAQIDAVLGAAGEEYQILFTDAVGDGERKAKAAAEALGGEEARFYACGGDGTANEIVNGIAGYPNIAFGIIPIGSGNDTVRNFQDDGDFLSVEAQIKGQDKPIDLIRVDGPINGKEQSRYCLNMINIGFDSNVVEASLSLKRKPLISGPAAYMLAALGMIVQKKGTALILKEGETTLREGKMLLCAISNGSFCGGGFYSSPQAEIDDGYFDVNIVSDIPRRRFLDLLPKYKAGTHLNDPKAQDVVAAYRCKAITVDPYDGAPFHFCVDGEILEAERFSLTMCEHALRFIHPAKL